MKKQVLIALLFLNCLDLQAQTPTWADNIACIVYTRCTGCHNPNGIAPFSLIDYADVFSFAGAIQINVNDGTMPPWPPDPLYQTYAHERVLSQSEITLINDWVNAGAPQGNPNNAPVPPVYVTTAQITSPDLSIVMPTYTVPTLTNDLYRCFVIPDVNNIDKFITGMESLPGNSAIVHHILVYADTSQTTIQLDNADPDPGYTSFGGVGSNTATLIGAWVPGATPTFVPAGMGIKLLAHSNIIMQIHYPFSSSGQTDSTRLNFLFTSAPGIRNVTIAPILNHTTNINEPLFIPADSIKTFYETQLIPFNATILSVAPHMHLVGTSIKSFAVTVFGDTIKLIDIKNWDFHWQGAYFFRQPIKIPAGATLYAEAVYDNTSNNPENPNSPPQDVQLGEATTDEMMLVYFHFLPYLNGDENIIVDTSTVVSTYNNCSFTSTGIGQLSDVRNDVLIYPNPVADYLNIEIHQKGLFIVELTDVTGKVIFRKENASGYVQLDCSKFANGIYSVSITGENYFQVKQLEVK